VSTAGLILAAGESRRMGSHKALLPYRGSTFLETLVGLFTLHCSPVIVTLGAGADQIVAGLPKFPDPAPRFVVNQQWARGQITSMQCGLRAVPSEAEGVLFTLVDHPAISSSTVESLLASRGGLLRVPRYQGRRGHPIWFSRELVPEFLALPETGAARDVVRRHESSTVFLDVDDPGIVADIDDPAAYRSLMGAAQ
jgi:molybdenum cofactor cytidylyltransferase